jgi:DNA polymerase-3 subunit alpha
MRNLGQHAAGVAVGGCDLVERAVIERRKGDEHVVCFDKRLVEDTGLVKMDILGLETLDIIDLATRYIRERRAKRVNLGAIPLDDEKVLANFAAGKTTGVFQYESGVRGGCRRTLRGGGSLTFEDVAAVSALNRPSRSRLFWTRNTSATALTRPR